MADYSSNLTIPAQALNYSIGTVSGPKDVLIQLGDRQISMVNMESRVTTLEARPSEPLQLTLIDSTAIWTIVAALVAKRFFSWCHFTYRLGAWVTHWRPR